MNKNSSNESFENIFSDLNSIDSFFINIHSNFQDKEDYSQISSYERYNQNIEKIFPLIFQDNSCIKIKEKSNGDITNEDFKNLFMNRPNKKQFSKNYIENIQQFVKIKLFSKKPFKNSNNVVGRKKKSDESPSIHNKFSDDNLMRRCKHIILESILSFINKKIDKIYSKENKDILNQMKLFKLSQNVDKTSKVEYYKLLFNKSLQSIFSEDISKRYSKFNPNHNKNIIEKLMNEKIETKRIIFSKIFNLTFMDCLNHFRGTDYIEELDGMKKLNEYLLEKDFGAYDQEYRNILQYFIENYEYIINDKGSRRRSKNT